MVYVKNSIVCTFQHYAMRIEGFNQNNKNYELLRFSERMGCLTKGVERERHKHPPLVLTTSAQTLLRRRGVLPDDTIGHRSWHT